VQFDPAEGRGQRGTHRPRATAQVDHDQRPFWGKGLIIAGMSNGLDGLAGPGDRLVHEEFGTAPGDENSRVHRDPQAAELGPAQNLFQWQPGGAPVHHGGEVGGGACRGDEQPCLVLGEDTAAGAEPGGDEGEGRKRRSS
jgi:hypothetical protein